MAWIDEVAELHSECLATFGQSVIYRRAGVEDVTISAIPEDPVPEDGISAGQYTVRQMLTSAVPEGPQNGDQMIIDDTLYDIFAVRREENRPLARVFLSQA